MTIQISDYYSNDQDLPMVHITDQSLITPDSVAVWPMRSLEDISGNGNALVWPGGAFDADGAGAVLTTANPIATPVAETDEMTVLMVYRIDSSTSPSSMLLGNLTPAAAPYAGVRLAYNYQSSTGNWLASTGLASPSAIIAANAIPASGAWVAHAYTTSTARGRIQHVSRSGTVVSSTFTQRAKGGALYLNGLPASVPSQVQTGNAGYLGYVAIYGRELDVEEIVDKIGYMVTLMAERGVTV